MKMGAKKLTTYGKQVDASQKRCETKRRLLLITNRKLNTSFRLVL